VAAADNAFSILKLVKSPFTGLFWVKTMMYIFGMAFIAFVSYGVYKAYFKKPPPTQAQNVNIDSPQPGSIFNFGQSGKTTISPDPFIEVFVEGTHGLGGDGDHEGKVGIRLGIEF